MYKLLFYVWVRSQITGPTHEQILHKSQINIKQRLAKISVYLNPVAFKLRNTDHL